MLQQIIAEAVVLLFALSVVSGLHGPSEFALQPNRHRKLPEYDCKDLFTIDDAEIERIRFQLPKLKEKKFDLVALNYSVRLDCLDDDEMKYVRHFLVTTRGKTILRYAVEVVYFPLKLFGLTSTVVNVNVSPVDINNTNDKPNVYALSNLTHISQVWTNENEFGTLCYSSKGDAEFNFMLHLFIPKSAVLYSNNILCYKANYSTGPSELKSSDLVYAVYALSFIVCLHISLLDYLLIEDTNKQWLDKMKYHSGETPFSFRRLVIYLNDQSENGRRSFSYKTFEGQVDKERWLKKTVYSPLNYGAMALSILIALLHYGLIYGHTWRENIIFINDYDTLDYILYTYSRRIDIPSEVMNTFVRIMYYFVSLVYFGYAFVFFQTLKPDNIALNIFKPSFVFTYKLDEKTKANKTKYMSTTAHFAGSYRLLLATAYWRQIFELSLKVPESRIWRIIDENMERDTSNANTILFRIVCLFVLLPLAFIERCFLILCGIASLIINIALVIIQALNPVLKYFLTGFAERLYHKGSTRHRLLYCIYGLLAYVIIWCVANVFIFNIVALGVSFSLYITVVAIPFNPMYGVPLMVIILSLFKYLFMFYEDFQSDYKSLLDTFFEILDNNFIKKDSDLEISDTDKFNLKISNKVRKINVELFNHISKKHLPTSRNFAFLFLKVAFATACIVIAFNALEESGTGIETLKLSDLFSVILLVMIPGIFHHLTKHRKNLQRKELYFKVFRYLKVLDRNQKLQDLVEYDTWDTSGGCNTDTSDSDSELGQTEDTPIHV